MKNSIYLLSLVLAFLFIQACENKHGKPTIDNSGVTFVKDGLEGRQTVAAASGLAITNSNNLRVIGFAKMMIVDLTKTGAELKKLGEDKRVGIEMDTLTTAHRLLIDSLSAKYNGVFDKVYMQIMVAEHERAVKLFAAALTNTDKDIKKTAAKTLPGIQMHLDSAKAILAGLK